MAQRIECGQVQSVALVQSMVLWVLISFVFGYFYHAISGKNEFDKAFSFFVALSFPTILLQIAIEREAVNRTQLI